MSSPSRRFFVRNRRDAVDELASSESRYVKKLRSLLNAYVIPLQNQHVFSPAEHATIFRSLQDMRDVHNQINLVLQKASEDENVINGVVAISKEFAL